MKEGIYILLLQNRETAILNGARGGVEFEASECIQTNYSPSFPRRNLFL
jgi:hypothetical protein